MKFYLFVYLFCFCFGFLILSFFLYLFRANCVDEIICANSDFIDSNCFKELVRKPRAILSPISNIFDKLKAVENSINHKSHSTDLTQKTLKCSESNMVIRVVNAILSNQNQTLCGSHVHKPSFELINNNECNEKSSALFVAKKL